MTGFSLETHLVQTPEWGDFKTRMKTPAIRVGDIQFTKHKLPLVPYYIGYAPRVNFLTQKFSFKELRQAAKSEKCALIRFDVPNVLANTEYSSAETKLLKDISSKCNTSPRSTFAKWNVLLDLRPSEEEITARFTQKTRYNCKLAAKKGVTVKLMNDEKGYEIFEKLHFETAKRQGFFPHPKEYYKSAFTQFRALDRAYILGAFHEGEPLAAWMLFTSGNTLYYPYGGSSEEHRNVMASNLLAYEAIRLGKKLGCTLFDMWGATNDEKDPWWGFTRFKLGYGGSLVSYVPSYDYVVNPIIAHSFNLAYNTFWALQSLRKKLFSRSSTDK